ncbi:hypothetical protein GDO86_007441 [Hymenochirus boettgeri]|uniref:Scaffolding anchor of CK1 domain-containing protein n=1 Tax=Hymenochirus boettgeri TaxID=247094 RepID=A0A8T2J0Y7_9PIPI|nr:hypothetical protein GDO86_007441 [Hymenochirus boettgeri]
MADSQVSCLRDDHVNHKVTEDSCDFYYSEEHRLGLEDLLRGGRDRYREHIKQHNIRGFLSTKEQIDLERDLCQHNHCTDPRPPRAGKGGANGADKASSLDYWPDLSDTEIPPLDLGWPENGHYRGVSTMLVYTHPPKEHAPTIKAVIRNMIREARKVIAIVMDYFTDREVFKEILDAADKKRVPVYIILDEEGVKYFLEMCETMKLSSFLLRNIRVRYVSGVGFYMPLGKIKGSLTHKYLMVDGEKVAFGSFRFTWSSFRVDRSIMTLLSGKFTECFDIEFRELYAISEEVNLYQELSIPDYRPSPMIGDRARSSTVARKLINPKYSLVVGRTLAPGEMLRFGTPNINFNGEDGESEKEKRMDKFLSDLITIEQEVPEIVRLDDLPKSLSPKKGVGKVTEDVQSTKSSKKMKLFSSFRKTQNSSPEKVVEGDFVLLNKIKTDKVSLGSSKSHSTVDLKNSGQLKPQNNFKPEGRRP